MRLEGSVAVYVTVVLPIGKECGELKTDCTITCPELSVAEGAVQVTDAVGRLLSVSLLISGSWGLVKTGSSLSEITNKHNVFR